MGSKCLLWLFFVFTSVVTTWSTVLEPDLLKSEAIAFLKKYGYITAEKDGEPAYTINSDISAPLIEMQAFAGLPKTGILDLETTKLIKRKRCGVKDINPPNLAARQRRFILQQGWTKKSISYRVVNGSSTLDKARVEELMRQGLAVWAPHGGLSFHKQDHGRADIQVSFVAGVHGDGFPFDGPGRVVAHAFPPPHGAMHFDDDELWGDDPAEDQDDVTDFFAVAVHEIGHALGMSHSNEKASVMYPYYQVPVDKLHTDDILGMQELYFKDQKAAEVMTESSAVSQSSFTKPDGDDADEGENYMPDLCMTNYDTLQVLHGQIYVFEEEWVWVLRDRNELAPGYPQRFHDVFKGLPKHVTIIKTIYQKENGNVVIFSGRKFWEFNRRFRLTRTGNISKYRIPKSVPELTTVFLSNYNNKTYLIEEERYWRFDERTRRMDAGYPREMSAWRRVPYPVDAAIVWKGDTYFFQGPRFWRFDNTLVQAHEYYPLPTAQIWFACAPTPDMNTYITNDGP